MRVGFCRQAITPEYSMGMAGYDRRSLPSDGVLDDIYVSVIAVEDDNKGQMLICSYDLLGTDTGLCARVRKAASERFSIAENRIWVSATHTHSAPGAIFYRRTLDENYMEKLVSSSMQAIASALEDLSCAKAKFVPASVKGVASVRTMDSDEAGNFAMPADMILFERENGDVVLNRFVCHPTVLNEKNTCISRDLPGACARQSKNGERTLFLNGPCADISTRYSRRESTPNEVERLGGIWAKALDNALENRENSSDMQISISSDIEELYMPAAKFFSGEEKERLMESLRERMANAKDIGAEREFNSRLAVLERPTYGTAEGRDIFVTYLDLGDLIIVGLPLETNYEAGERFRERLEKTSLKKVWIVCYTGGYDGYLPSGRPLDFDSSYEDLAAIYTSDAEEILWRSIEKCVSRNQN
ncbi:MAG: neutral/alkaline non-lysosomal ceramidase N-terminal domain-containing protein [Clostridia bacterium]|nr:neutral/alkaline non-lysosomal ceramidase N-terminal domain-containing protein [Clostridia bacterium]